MNDKTLNIGMLGAAHIGEEGIVKPARKVEGIELHAIAARDEQRARAYAKEHGIPIVHPGYEALLADPRIHAIYNPLPNSLHCEWSIRALEAGKHVLCEKPLAANANEARRMADTADRCGRVLMEALHYRFHPLAARMQQAVGQLGQISRIETSMCAPIARPGDIRYDYSLAGGSLMDMGVYSVSLLRFLAQAAGNPDLAKLPAIDAVKAKLRNPNIDRAMKIEVSWPNGCRGQLHCSLWSMALLKLGARVVGEHGELRVFNPYMPHAFHRFELRLHGQRLREKFEGESTYTCQLREFLHRISGGEPRFHRLQESITTMAFIDRIYATAGLPRRGT